MNNPILTFIVPVYNVENYILECFDSIYNEALIDRMEIILVDDGSTDKSGEICDNLSKKKNTFTFHKKNGGLASARNYGLSKANGKYITFIDSDDKIESKSISSIIEYISKIDKDLIFLNISKFYKDGYIKDIGEKIHKEELLNVDKNKCIYYLSSRPKFPASACAKIYLRKFLSINDISFPKDNRISEDMGFAFKCILKANTFDKIDLPYYYYRQNRNNSITSNVTIKSFKGLSQFILDSINLYTINGKPKNESIKFMFNFLAYEYSILLWHYNFLLCHDQQYAYDFLKEYKYVMKWSSSRKNKIIKLFLNLFGIRVTSRLLYLIKKG